MKSKINNFKVGLILGAILPPITLGIIYLTLTDTLTIGEFIKKLQGIDAETNIFIWTLLPVFAAFSFFYFKKYDNASKGIVLPTMIYTFILVILNF